MSSHSLLWCLSFMLDAFFRCLAILGHFLMLKCEELRICLKTPSMWVGNDYYELPYICSSKNLHIHLFTVFVLVQDNLHKEDFLSPQPGGPAWVSAFQGSGGENWGYQQPLYVGSLSPSGFPNPYPILCCT